MLSSVSEIRRLHSKSRGRDSAFWSGQNMPAHTVRTSGGSDDFNLFVHELLITLI